MMRWFWLCFFVCGCGGAPEPEILCDAIGDGWQRCYPEGVSPSRGSVDRVAAAVCESGNEPLTCVAESEDVCQTDGDCVEGQCAQTGPCGSCGCSTTCTTDDQCGSGQICACAAEGVQENTQCVAGCSGPADCNGRACGMSLEGCGWALAGTFCRADTDSCRFDADCGASEACVYGSGGWQCSTYATCECG